MCKQLNRKCWMRWKALNGMDDTVFPTCSRLTHWGRDKIVTIFQMTFWDAFREWKCSNFDLNFTVVFSQGYNQQYSSVGWDNGLVPSWRQAIRIQWLLVYYLLTDICVNWPQWLNAKLVLGNKTYMCISYCFSILERCSWWKSTRLSSIVNTVAAKAREWNMFTRSVKCMFGNVFLNQNRVCEKASVFETIMTNWNLNYHYSVS